MTTRLDHIVIGAATLEQGVEYIRECLGVTIPKGGEHPAMGTHNHIMRLGADVFLEVIAVNPAARSPSRPRWYGLDDPFVRGRLAVQPQLLTWVVNTADISDVQTGTDFCFGTPVTLSRGDLSWLFGIPDDGRLLAGGMLPYLIQWQTDHHPARDMSDLGCRLLEIVILHPQVEWLSSILAAIDAAGLITLNRLPENVAPYLEVHLETPTGAKTLSSRA